MALGLYLFRHGTQIAVINPYSTLGAYLVNLLIVYCVFKLYIAIKHPNKKPEEETNNE